MPGGHSSEKTIKIPSSEQLSKIFDEKVYSGLLVDLIFVWKWHVIQKSILLL